MWGQFNHPLLVAYTAIGCIWIFLFIFIGVTVGTQTHRTQHYMTPAGVSSFLIDVMAMVRTLMLLQ